MQFNELLTKHVLYPPASSWQAEAQLHSAIPKRCYRMLQVKILTSAWLVCRGLRSICSRAGSFRAGEGKAVQSRSVLSASKDSARPPGPPSQSLLVPQTPSLVATAVRLKSPLKAIPAVETTERKQVPGSPDSVPWGSACASCSTTT